MLTIAEVKQLRDPNASSSAEEATASNRQPDHRRSRRLGAAITEAAQMLSADA
ncbi:MAG: hypothetical protein JO197_12185 [Acidobacteria bacterium]|nr:hypothetical protein [Acidobacteriota bacterium]MBV9475311.1 hypothetical protein [Acidobacteriota bacterium]